MYRGGVPLSDGCEDQSAPATKGVDWRQSGNKAQREQAQRRAEDLSAVIQEIRQAGAVSLREIATGLSARGVPTARGGVWPSSQVMRVLQRLEGRA